MHIYELEGKTDTVEALRRVHRAASIAASTGHLEVVKVLLDNGADISVTNADGRTPLESAASNGHFEVVKLLVASEETDRRALIGREKVLGVEHPDKLISVHDRPSMILYQGKYEAAEEMNRRKH